MTAQLNQETIDYMIAYVTQATGVVPPGTLEFDASLNPVHLLVKEKEFKYGKGKEYIAFTDGGKNQFGKEVKYVFHACIAKLLPRCSRQMKLHLAKAESRGH